MWSSNLQAGFEHSPDTRHRHLRDSEPRSTVRPFRQAFCAPRGRRTMLERPAAKLGIELSFVVRVRRGHIARTEVRAHPKLATERIATGRVPSRVLRDEDERRTSDGSVLRAGWDGRGGDALLAFQGRPSTTSAVAGSSTTMPASPTCARRSSLSREPTESTRIARLPADPAGQTSSLGLGLVSEPL